MRRSCRRSALVGVGMGALAIAGAALAVVSSAAVAHGTAGGPVITGGSYDAATRVLTVEVTPPPDGGIDTITLYDRPCSGASCSFGGYQGTMYWPLGDHHATRVRQGVDPSPTGTWYVLIHGYCTACDTVYSNVFPVATSGTKPTTTTKTTAPATTTRPATTTTTAKTTTPPPAPSTSKKAVGTVSGMQGTVEIQSSGGRWITVPSNFTFHTNDHLRTAADGRLMITLADGTYFTLGPRSDLVLDDFVYDPNRKRTISATISLGIFRFVTGKACRKPCAGYEKVTMPVGTIGVRGTDFIVRATWQEATIDVHRGAVTVRAHGGKPVTVTGPRRAWITPKGLIRVLRLSPAAWSADVANLR